MHKEWHLDTSCPDLIQCNVLSWHLKGTNCPHNRRVVLCPFAAEEDLCRGVQKSHKNLFIGGLPSVFSHEAQSRTRWPHIPRYLAVQSFVMTFKRDAMSSQQRRCTLPLAVEENPFRGTQKSHKIFIAYWILRLPPLFPHTAQRRTC